MPLEDAPLADLHAFATAARHLSFTRAAAELGVTQGAVSQRIRRLEGTLGRPLFERLTRALALTADGKTPFSYYLVHSPKAAVGSPLDAFVEWLRAEVAVWRSTACAHPISSGASH